MKNINLYFKVTEFQTGLTKKTFPYKHHSKTSENQRKRKKSFKKPEKNDVLHVMIFKTVGFLPEILEAKKKHNEIFKERKLSIQKSVSSKNIH